MVDDSPLVGGSRHLRGTVNFLEMVPGICCVQVNACKYRDNAQRQTVGELNIVNSRRPRHVLQAKNG